MLESNLKKAVLLAVFGGICIAIVIWRLGFANSHTETPVPAPVPRVRTHPPEGELSRGTLVAPALLPGSTCASAGNMLGSPSDETEYVISWDTKEFKVTAAKSSSSGCFVTGFVVQVHAGRTVGTRDGIVLGLTELADAERILRGRIAPGSESVEAPEGNWQVKLELAASPDFPYQTIYRTDFDQSAEERLGHIPSLADLRSSLITQYELEIVAPPTSDGTDKSGNTSGSAGRK